MATSARNSSKHSDKLSNVQFKPNRNQSQSQKQRTCDRIKSLYPAVNEDITPLPRTWSAKDKFNTIGLSQNNLRVHYKGDFDSIHFDFHRFISNILCSRYF